ncbi:protein-export chaperone SecB [Woeseia oceani]|uniref:Protein-export protein SecB n=1 Tax=Woeseia oceani TaxID=1548547 RepID=A0A193LJY2_9GAMM|nr:protein-export chaperone SecB [Woeseia oceani]ANO52855.1 protein-export chaperone SecB [Woeseia oceani]
MAEQEEQDRRIGISKIYIKDFSFESPRGPEVFTSGEWSPKTNLNLRSAHAPAPGDMHEVILTITVEAKHDDKTLFLIELQQAGLFQIAGYNEQEFEAIVGSFCPATLFPYARESIANIVSKGGFPEFVLQPINFDVLYAESRKQAAAQKAANLSGEGSLN